MAVVGLRTIEKGQIFNPPTKNVVNTTKVEKAVK